MAFAQKYDASKVSKKAVAFYEKASDKNFENKLPKEEFSKG